MLIVLQLLNNVLAYADSAAGLEYNRNREIVEIFHRCKPVGFMALRQQTLHYKQHI